MIQIKPIAISIITCFYYTYNPFACHYTNCLLMVTLYILAPRSLYHSRIPYVFVSTFGIPGSIGDFCRIRADM